MDRLSDYSERELLASLAAGNEQAFTQLFNKYWDRVYSTALILLKSADAAEDIAQEVFFRIWNNRAKAGEIDRLDNYLFFITRNLVYTRLSRTRVEDAYLHYLQHKLPDNTVDTGRQASINELSKAIEAGIRKLPAQQQRAFRLSREEGLSHAEIAALMKIKQSAVKDYIVRAIASLRKFLHEYPLSFLIIFFASHFPFIHLSVFIHIHASIRT